MTTSKLRIAMLSVHSCPVGNLGAKDTGGMSVYVRELARQLGKQGISVDVYTRVHDPEDSQTEELGRNVRLIHLKAGEDTDIGKLAVYPHLPDFADNLDEFRKQNDCRYDLVFSHYWLSGWVGECLRRRWQVPHVMMFHTLGAVKNAIGIGETEPELRVETETSLTRNCHHIIAATETEKKDLIQHYGASPERISVIPCGVNLDLFQPQSREMAKQQLGLGDDKVILYVGRVEPLKGIDRLIRAVSYLQNGHRPRLVIIGGGEHSRGEMERLQKLSSELCIRDSVSFLGMIKHEKLPSFYSAATVCVVPSYYESFGMVALEALACGTPIVATDVGDLRSIIRQGETGYMVKDNAPGGLADKISLLLSSTDAETALSIRASVTRFGWPNIAQQVISKVLAGYFLPVALC